MIFGKKEKNLGGRLWQRLGRYLRDRRGNIAVLTALLIIPMVGIMGIATETSGWFLVQRAEQNAADSAVLAAAQNAIFNGSGTSYVSEGRSVAADLGFINGTNSTTVTPVNNQACPSPLTTSDCYKVTITRAVPINFANIVGYTGTGGSGSQTIIASAMARAVDTPISDCITSLGTGKDTYRVDGGPSVDLSGCVVQANGDGKCAGAGADGNVLYFFIAGSDSGCGPVGGTGTVTDPYTSTYPPGNIPANTCANPSQPTSYWQASNNYGKNKGKTISLSPNTEPAANDWHGTASANQVYCGDVTLSANTTISGSGTITIENGSLNLNGHTLTATGVTLIFTGPTVGTNFTPSHSPPTNGTLDISAPTSGTWHGVAIYQDPNLTSGVDWSSSGNSLNWDITGLIYMPNSKILFSGTINKASNGADCFAIVDSTFRVNGNVATNEHQTGCNSAGLTPPNSIIKQPVLVQ